MKTKRPHQKVMVDSVLKAFNDNDRATALMTCGSGKTLCGLWVHEDIVRPLNGSISLILVPSLALMSQTIAEYRTTFKGLEEGDYIAVCSDEGIVDVDLEVTVTTDAQVVKSFIQQNPMRHRVVFCTYQSAIAIEKGTYFDFGLFDEAHRTTGPISSRFSHALCDSRIRIGKRLFMTATARHYEQRGEEKAFYSMDDLDVYGPRAYVLSFSSAVKQQLVCGARVAVALIDRAALNGNGRAALATAISKAMEQLDLRTVVAFTPTIAEARRLAELHKELDDKVNSDWVCGAMGTALRKEKLNALAQSGKAVLYNSRCLTEGVDVPAIDGVVFTAPRKSTVDIVQAVGRTSRLAKGKTHGTIVIPVICDPHDVEEPDLGDVYEIVRALLEDLETVDIKTENGSIKFTQGSGKDLVDVLTVDFNSGGSDAGLNVQGLADLIRIKVLDPGHDPAQWETRLQQLKEYVDRHGFPTRETNLKLYYWFTYQRSMYRLGRMSESRRDLFKELLAVKVIRINKSWDETVAMLAQHVEQHNVLPTRSSDSYLYTWLRNQRRLESQCKLTVDQVARLDTFTGWRDVYEYSWDDRYLQLKEYVDRHGRMPKVSGSLNAEELTLARWVSRWTSQKNKGKLEEHQIERLRALSIRVLPTDKWTLGLNKVVVHVKLTGRFPNVNDVNERPMYHWLTRQRKRYRDGKTSAEKVAALDARLPGWRERLT